MTHRIPLVATRRFTLISLAIAIMLCCSGCLGGIIPGLPGPKPPKPEQPTPAPGASEPATAPEKPVYVATPIPVQQPFPFGVVALRSTLSGRFVMAGIGPQSRLAARSPHPGDWARFITEARGGNRVALRSQITGRYVSARNGQLLADSVSVGPRQTFAYHRVGKGTWALQSVVNGKFVRAGLGSWQLSWLGAVAPHKKGWETFRIAHIQ